MTVASNRKVYVGSQQIEPNATWTDSVSGYAAEIGLLLPLEWGTVEAETFTLPMPVGDGALYEGSRAQPREFELSIRARMSNAVPAAYREAFQDRLHERIVSWFPLGQRVVLKVARKELTAAATLGDVERVLEVRATGNPSWDIQPSGVGQFYLSPVAEATIPLMAPFPWWLDSTASSMYKTATDAFTHASPAVVSQTNDGNMACGIQLAIQGDATITEWTAEVTIGAVPFTITASVALDPATWVVLDYKCADPTRVFLVSGVATADLLDPAALKAAASIRGSITAWPMRPFTAQVGTVATAVTVETGTGAATLKTSFRRQYVDP